MAKLILFLYKTTKIVLIAASLFSVLSVSSYTLFGHKVIEDAYNQQSIGLLNNIIEGRGVHSLPFYFNLADNTFFPIFFLLLKILGILAIFYTLVWLIQRKFIALLTILCLFIISIMIRLPNMDRPLGDHHEWVTQHALIILKNWESQGALKHNFCLLMTFPGENNRGIYDYSGRLINANGEGYYVSFPPGALIWPYLIFKLFHLPVTPFNLQLLNMLFHLVSALILFGMIKKILASSFYSKQWIAMIGIVFFIFLPGHLWFFCNIYSWDIFWFYAWIANVALALNLKQHLDEKKPAGQSLLFFGIGLFVLIYSDIYGFLYALTIILMAIEMMPKEKSYRQMLLVTVTSSLFAILLTAVQYSSIDGGASLLDCILSNRRNYHFQGLSDLKSMFLHATTGYNLIFIPLILAALAALIQQRKEFLKNFAPMERTALYLFFFPSLLFFIIQTRWSAIHDYSMLRLAPFLIVLLVILLSKLRIPLNWPVKIIIFIFIGKLISACTFYYGACFTYSKDVEFFKRTGTFMRHHIKDDEVVFILTRFQEGIDPRFTYYVERNAQWVPDKIHALGWLLTYQKPKGVIFTFNPNQGAGDPQHIAPEDISAELTKEGITQYRLLKSSGINQNKSVEFIMDDGEKRILQFKKGLLISDAFFNTAGEKVEEIIIDYWTLTSTDLKFDSQGNIISREEI